MTEIAGPTRALYDVTEAMALLNLSLAPLLLDGAGPPLCAAARAWQVSYVDGGAWPAVAASYFLAELCFEDCCLCLRGRSSWPWLGQPR